MSDYITIPLSKHQKSKYKGLYEAIVSDEDKELAEFNWSAKHSRNKKVVYAHRVTRDELGNKVSVYLHRAVLESKIGVRLGDNEFCDHINGNGLDNRRENLRVANNSQNTRNGRKRADNTSGYKGVSFDKKSNRYVAQIESGGKNMYLGRYATPEEAHEVYKKKAIELFGEFARFD